MGYSFDGPTRKITLTSGTTSADIDDLYSRWYDWLMTSDNSKYFLALRNVGGDEVSDTKDLGITFFLTNGWRIIPDDADHRLKLNGNLYTDPAGYSPIDTVPGRSIIVKYSVSNLVDSTLAQMPEIEYASFNGGVSIDAASGYSGTDFPVGTPQAPVNNMNDALLIANIRGFTTFYIAGDITLDSGTDFEEMIFVGESKTKSVITISSDADVENCEFYDAQVTGILDGGNVLKGCLIGDLNYVNGYIEQCVLTSGTITLGGSAEAHFLDCWSGVVGSSTPIIDMGGSGQGLGLRNYNGGIKITNKTGPEKISIDLNSGHVILDSTVTDGEIIIRGIGKITDNSNGATVDDTDFVNPTTVSDAVWEHDTALAALSDIAFIKKIEGGRWIISGNDMIFYDDDNLTEVARFTLTYDANQNPTERVRV